ncbi:hypothetical protein LINGRAHAP2_LOCUS23710 [Linum grandiflorum]
MRKVFISFRLSSSSLPLETFRFLRPLPPAHQLFLASQGIIAVVDGSPPPLAGPRSISFRISRLCWSGLSLIFRVFSYSSYHTAVISWRLILNFSLTYRWGWQSFSFIYVNFTRSFSLRSASSFHSIVMDSLPSCISNKKLAVVISAGKVQSGHDRCRVSLLARVFWPLPKPLYALHHDLARQWKVRPREVQVFEAGHGLIQFMFTSEEVWFCSINHGVTRTILSTSFPGKLHRNWSSINCNLWHLRYNYLKFHRIVLPPSLAWRF